MTEDSDLSRVVFPSEEPPTSETTPEAKPPNKARRMIMVGLLAFIVVLVVMVVSQSSLMKPQSQRPKTQARPVKPSPTDPVPVPAVQVAWEGLDLGALPADAAQSLKSGKYYYDNHYPGNFGLAIGYWKQALELLSGADREGVQNLVTSAELELAHQFSKDSGDVIVLLKQHKRDQAVSLLTSMRADFLDNTARQYLWASVKLSLYRRK